MSGRTGEGWPRVRVHPGSGVVDRCGDSLLVVPVLPRPQLAQVGELLQLCRRPDPTGRDRPSALRALLDPPSPGLPGFALLIRTGRALRVLAHGPVQVLVDGRPAQRPDPRGLTDQLLEDGAWMGLTITAEGAATGDPTDELPLDLTSGAVPGAGVTLHGVPPAAEAGTGVTALRPAVRFRSVLLGECAVRAPGRRAPLPIAGEDAEGTAAGTASSEPEILVEGVRCPRGHFTDPGRSTCLACGTPLSPDGHRIAAPRPPLGILVTDGGTIYPVTGDFVIGRDPARAPEVLAGRARPLRLGDAERSTSRVHAHLTVDGWQVLLSDDRSANGTFLSGHGAAGPWLPVPPQTPVPLAHGDRVRLGRRQLLFETWREGIVPPVLR